ncbi:aminoglycoside phosphotransferase [Streptomyces sp. NPDC001941]|uniref:aminoglycoside phosphotransferase n=1 Tax=Streptomyces sp. NPDC001941 TaxID=3154659 RepID=UPI003329775B
MNGDMRVERIPLPELPAPVRQAIAARIGWDCRHAEVQNGTSSALATWVWPTQHGTTDTQMVFLKGLPLDEEGITELRTEIAVAPYLPPTAPRMLWHEEAGGWLVVCFEGLNASAWTYFGSDSEHLPQVATVLSDLSGRAAPAVVTRTAWEKWGIYCDPADRPVLTGDRLVHADPAATNFMTGRDGRTWLIDWAWAMRGPNWLDTALWGFRLILDGEQTPEHAARWCARIPAFAAAPRRSLTLLTQAEARWWEALQAYGTPNVDDKVTAAREWAAYWA